jgi:hypothetical protein
MIKASVSLIALVVMLTAPSGLRADSLPPVSNDESGPNGYWTFKNALAPASVSPVELSGIGQMISVGNQFEANSSMVVVDMMWQPDEFTLGQGFGPAIVTWTALSAGEFTVTATGAPSQGTSDSLLRQATGSAQPASQTGTWTECMNFEPGDSICLVLPATTGTNDSDFFVISSVTVPEPSLAIALLGFVGSAGSIAVVCGWRRRKKLTAFEVVA